MIYMHNGRKMYLFEKKKIIAFVQKKKLNCTKTLTLHDPPLQTVIIIVIFVIAGILEPSGLIDASHVTHSPTTLSLLQSSKSGSYHEALPGQHLFVIVWSPIVMVVAMTGGAGVRHILCRLS